MLIDIGVPAQRVLAAIREAGGRPMLVGGCVRDAIISPGAPVKDVDVEVYGLSLEAISDALSIGGRPVDEVGKSFGVLKVRMPQTLLGLEHDLETAVS